MSAKDPKTATPQIRVGDLAFDPSEIYDRKMRGKPGTRVWIERANEEPDPVTCEVAVIGGELVFARVGPRRLRMLEPGSAEWPQHGEWPNLWWRFQGGLALSRAGLVLRWLALWPAEPEDPDQDERPFLGVNAAVLRAIRADEIIRLALEAGREYHEQLVAALERREDYSPGWWEVWEKRDAVLTAAISQAESAYAETRKAGGRPQLNDTHYKAVAYACLDLYADRATGIHAALADRYGVSTKTVEAWIREARRRGLLAPGHAGRSTFSEGPNLRQGRKDG